MMTVLKSTWLAPCTPAWKGRLAHIFPWGTVKRFPRVFCIFLPSVCIHSSTPLQGILRIWDIYYYAIQFYNEGQLQFSVQFVTDHNKNLGWYLNWSDQGIHFQHMSWTIILMDTSKNLWKIGITSVKKTIKV